MQHTLVDPVKTGAATWDPGLECCVFLFYRGGPFQQEQEVQAGLLGVVWSFASVLIPFVPSTQVAAEDEAK